MRTDMFGQSGMKLAFHLNSFLVLKRDLVPRANTNTAPVYTNDAASRSKSRRPPDGMTYSVSRARQHNFNHPYPRTSPKQEEIRNKQPTHNATEQIRRQKETQLFNIIQEYSNRDEIRLIRDLYSDRDSRSSDSSRNVRITKKVLLNTTHSAVRNDKTPIIRFLQDYKRNLMDRLAKLCPDHIQNILEYDKQPCRIRDCERCCRNQHLRDPRRSRHEHSYVETPESQELVAPHAYIKGSNYTPEMVEEYPETYNGLLSYDDISYMEEEFPEYYDSQFNPSGASSSVGDFNEMH